jgi:hypothetical protein
LNESKGRAMTMRNARRVIEAASALSVISFLTTPACAAEALDGSQLGVIWALPFIGMLLSIALGPLVAAHFWEHHQGKITGAAGVAAWILPAQAQWLFGLSADRLGTMDPGLVAAGLLPLLALPPLWYLHRIKTRNPITP